MFRFIRLSLQIVAGLQGALRAPKQTQAHLNNTSALKIVRTQKLIVSARLAKKYLYSDERVTMFSELNRQQAGNTDIQSDENCKYV